MNMPNPLKIIVRKLCFTAVSRTPAQICIVGAGPAGFYAAQHLTKKLESVHVDIIEKLPVPFGLIRYGVAPDHPDVKNVINTFTKTAKQSNVNFYGNITLGRDITLRQLRNNYHVVLLTYGAEEDKLLGIENEEAKNVLSARRFVGWYNGLPDDKDLEVDLSGRVAAIFGQGNVAMDVARMLLTPIDMLRKTDITAHALQCLSESSIKQVYLVGRRGPLQAAFTTKELREQIKMPGCKTIWRQEDFKGVTDAVPFIQRPRKRLVELMLKSLSEAQVPGDDLKIFKPIFCRSPVKFKVCEGYKLSKVEMICNKLVGDDLINKSCVPTNKTEILDCDIAFRSIGYKSVCVDHDINFDKSKGLVRNNTGRVSLHNSNNPDYGLYVAGWLHTGPVGVILNTMSNAFQVAGNIKEDLTEKIDKLGLNNSKPGFEEISKILQDNNVHIVDWNGWEKIDKFEVEQGAKQGKPREKVTNIAEMLKIVGH